MKLWKLASLTIKDGPSLMASNDILTAAVVKATSHDEFSIDTESALFIYRHVRSNPATLKPLVSAISTRVKRTRSWAVALKGLMLMHGFFRCKTTAAESIGRLPFDLSTFGEGNSRISKSGRFTLFVRAYFAFLDRRSVLFHDGNSHSQYDEESSVMTRLVLIRKMQVIVDSLIRIKPIGESMRMVLINEAMENVISEILEVYGWICRRISEVLPNVHSKVGKTQAELALRIVTKSVLQGKELKKYFQFCKDLGVSNAQEIPEFVTIPQDDVLHLEELVRMAETEDGGEEETEVDTSDEEEGRETRCELVDLLMIEHNDAFEQEHVSSSSPSPSPSPPPPSPPRAPPTPPKVDVPDLISF